MKKLTSDEKQFITDMSVAGNKEKLLYCERLLRISTLMPPRNKQYLSATEKQFIVENTDLTVTQLAKALAIKDNDIIEFIKKVREFTN